MGKRLPVGRGAARAPRSPRAAAAAADVVMEPLPIVHEPEQTHVNSSGRSSVVPSVDGKGDGEARGQRPRPGGDDAVPGAGGASLTVGADDLPDGLVVADATGRVVALNRAAERVLGRTAV